MPKKTPQLAKLTRPRLHKAVPRERLFAKLDDAREHKPVICVVGPPGGGLTSDVTVFDIDPAKGYSRVSSKGEYWFVE